MTDIWPDELLPPGEDGWTRGGRFVSGGMLVSGGIAGGRTDGGGMWLRTIGGIWLQTPREIKLWRTLETILGDGVTSFIVPSCECRFKPSIVTDAAPPEGTAHDDDTLFDDGSGYLEADIIATLAADVALRDTTVVINMALGGELIGGERFAIDHLTKGRRMYEIGRILEVDGPLTTVTVWPPFREDEPAGVTANFDDPGCLMRILNPQDMGATLIDGQYATVGIRFIEEN